MEESLDSILEQNFENMEVIVVNDGSTDSTSSILRKSKYNHFRLIERENLGLTASLIEACELARGRWIARLDCGDMSLPSRLEKQIECLRKNNIVACFSHAMKIDQKGVPLHEQKSILIEGIPQLENFIFDNPLIHSTAVFSKDCYTKSGGYDKNFKVSQDFDLWTRMLERGRIKVLEEVLVYSRQDLGGISFKKKEEQAKAAALVSHRVSESIWANFESDINFWESFHRIRLNCWPYFSDKDFFHNKLLEFVRETKHEICSEMSTKLKILKLLGPNLYHYIFGFYSKFRYGVF